MFSILLISDIHGNFPALHEVIKQHPPDRFDLICNTGDSTVYAPFPNQTLDWLRYHKVVSIRGNTDDKVIKLLRGKTFNKPGKKEKRVMYTATARSLTPENRAYLLNMKKKRILHVHDQSIGLFHGSPLNHEEFLFADSPEKRFSEIAAQTRCDIVLTGHSHSPYYRYSNGVHFINPGSVGRMFDGNPAASYAILTLDDKAELSLHLRHFRCPYDIQAVVHELSHQKLPSIYAQMFRQGRKLN